MVNMEVPSDEGVVSDGDEGGGVMGGGGGSRSGSSVGVKMVGKGLNYISELHM